MSPKYSYARLPENASGTVLENVETEKVKILLVDDQPDNLLAVEAVLQPLGQEIVTAQSGREALRHLLEDDYAIILLDVMMPGMDGFETASLIRQRERSRYTPIIFITALGREMMIKAYGVGAVDYLYKPIVPEVLRSKVAVFVELSRKSALLKKHEKLLETRNAELERAIALRRAGEEEIKTLNTHLERRVLELSALNRELEAFSYSVSHDLRGPLSRISGFSQALLEDYAERLDDQGKVYLNRIHTSAQRMCQLVDDLLSLARLSRAELRAGSLDLSAVVYALASELQASDPHRQVEFRIAAGVTAVADATLLRVVLLNLLENAWKFTRQQPRATIEFGVAPQEAGLVYFVRDDGAGFDMQESYKLFNAFQRLHSSVEFEGTGIGLATVARIINRHGGQIWAEGAVGRGATFYFTLQGQGG